MKRSLIVIISAALLTFGVAQNPAPPSASRTKTLADQLQRKLDHIQQNGAQAHPDQRPTVLNEDEINAYFADGRVAFPKGVQSLRLTGSPGALQAAARVDFDAITAGQRSSNPLLMLFTGVHDITSTSRASGAGGKARIHIETVALDGVEIPRVALQFFLDRYVKPKHPEIGLDNTFTMPARIDTATVGAHKLTVTQK